MEGQQLEEALTQILDYTQGSSLARFSINRRRRSGYGVDLCMTMHASTMKISASTHFFINSINAYQPVTFFSSYLLIFCPRLCCFVCVRRLSSFVWSGCRLTNSCARSPRVTGQLIGSEANGEREEEGEDITQKTVPTPPRLPCEAAAPTTVEGVGAEATASTPDTVLVFRSIKLNI